MCDQESARDLEDQRNDEKMPEIYGITHAADESDPWDGKQAVQKLATECADKSENDKERFQRIEPAMFGKQQDGPRKAAGQIPCPRCGP